MFYIYSTLSANQDYDGVKVAGGAGVANRRSLDTAKGAVTIVTEAEMDVLGQNPVFRKHEKAGFILIEKRERNVEKVVKDMESRDKGAQETEETISKQSKAKVRKD